MVAILYVETAFGRVVVMKKKRLWEVKREVVERGRKGFGIEKTL
jgi:hypothetical protein